ncbi:Rad9 [Ostreococcus tauri]|uniref:Rad9 n=1 Tax=Ostreococcus tauri TaxID=70448 RepID=A0A090M5D6_OSTTA|nr:Rad9 [Ostreococcus tauri]CEF99386.1 Rad9 [Ostreococcus tauri]|eukprot:XP_003081644.2 Rad9 [Ostreococcus tauri]
MRADISAHSLRALHRSVAFLSRVGGEIMLDAREDGREGSLTLKSVNANRSAFARVRVLARAFDAFEVRGKRVQACALAKHVLASLRASARAETLSIELADDDAAREEPRVVVRTTSAKTGVTRTYEMCEVIDCEHVDAEMDAEAMPGKCVMRARAFGALLQHFASAAQEDVTITFGIEGEVCVEVDEGRIGNSSGNILTLSSFATAGAGLSQALQTSVSVRRDDESILFYRNTAGSKIEVTVNLKDLRGVVQLCEASDVDLAIYCAQAGAPVIAKPTADYKLFHQHGESQQAAAPSVDFEAELVLATVLPPEIANDASTQSERAEPSAPSAAQLPNVPIGSQPWSAVPDTEDGSQREIGGADEVGALPRPWGQNASTIANVSADEDWHATNVDDFVEATPPEKRRRS